MSRGSLHRSTLRTVGRLLGAVCIAWVCASCGGGQASSSGDDGAHRITEANDHLRGDWMLVEFRPEMGLEPVLAQLLAMQVGHLVARFDGQHLVATGIGVNAVRSYRVDEAVLQRIRLSLFDDSGVRYEVRGEFQGTGTGAGETLRFEALTPPWTGQGTLARSGGPR